MVCLRNTCINTLHKGDNEDNDNNNKCALSKKSPMPYYKHEQQFVFENSKLQTAMTGI